MSNPDPTTGHTPTPWIASSGRREYDTPYVAEVHDTKEEGVVSAFGLSETDKANVALIVRAVNAHEALVKIAEEAVSAWEGIESDALNGGRDEEAENACARAQEIRAALKLARGDA